MMTARHSQSTHASNKDHGLLSMYVCHVSLGEQIGSDHYVEWQKHNQGSKEVPDYLELLQFLDLRHETPRTPKRSLSGSTLPTHHRRRQLDYLTWPILTRRMWRARRPIIRSTPVNHSRCCRTNKKWVWSRIADCA